MTMRTTLSAALTRGALMLCSAAALAHAAPGGAAAAGETRVRATLWGLFLQSLDVFTIALIGGSLVAVFLAVRCAVDVRSSVLLPRRTLTELERLVGEGRVGEVRSFTAGESDFASSVLHAASQEHGRGRDAMLDAAETAATAEASRVVRQVELLGLIGNIAPLVGLAGTVWGMILAFMSLGATEGQAGPAELSVGISKALFHTLLGLVLAIPALLIAGIYRAAAERIITRGVTATSRMVERLSDPSS